MNKRTLAAALLCLALLCGCTPLNLSTEDLMRPPQLSENQSQVYNALMAALGTSASNVSLRYPRSGDNRSAFIFHDLDGDGQDEAMVFYSLAGADDDLYVNIMEKGQSGWYSTCDTPGAGSGVESVAFGSVSANDSRDILIGWAEDNSTVGQLSVMRYQDNALDTLYQGKYSRYTTADLDGDGTQELVLITMSSSGGKPFATLIQPDLNRLTAVSNLPFNVVMSSFTQLQAGAVGGGLQGIVVDGYDGQDFVSEVFLVQDGRLTLPFASGSDFYDQVTRKDGPVASRDVDGDGVLELPVQTQAPGGSGDTKYYYTVYSHLNADLTLTAVRQAYVSTEQSYTLFLPEGWLENVAVAATQGGETTFTDHSESAAGGGRILLRIRVYSEKDYQDKFDTDRYQKIGQRGNFLYYASVETGSDLSITQSQLAQLFELN